MFDEKVILKQAEFYNSFYLYEEKKILNATQRLIDNFEDIGFLYSIKTNPHPKVVKAVFSQGFGADAASLGEVLLSEKSGLIKNQIYFSAPGKSKLDIEKSIDKSIIIADSLNEVKLIQDIAQSKDIIAEIGIRINPDFTFHSNKGVSSKFGVDIEQLYENIEYLKSYKNIRIIGIHVHSRSQELDTDTLKNYYQNMFNLSSEIQSKLKIDLKFINLGSGIGIPYAADDSNVDTQKLGMEIKRLMKEFKTSLPNTKFYIETGRYAVGKSGVYATKVLDIKYSRGQKFVILDNTLNGFIRPALVEFVASFTNDPNPPENEPLFTHNRAFQYVVLNDETNLEKVNLVGNLCTSSDIIGKNIELPRLNIGDMLVITNAGSYAAVLSPMQFASMNPPKQLFLAKDGEIEL